MRVKYETTSDVQVHHQQCAHAQLHMHDEEQHFSLLNSLAVQ